MITLNNFDDVLKLADLIGTEGLNHYYNACKDKDHCSLIREAKN